ncbi:hypothetical protein M758_UG118000 [Ceratodon purpureus]|nr:hypothetical protein M758_UG118000 [Ceratodon purpureus]
MSSEKLKKAKEKLSILRKSSDQWKEALDAAQATHRQALSLRFEAMEKGFAKLEVQATSALQSETDAESKFCESALDIARQNMRFVFGRVPKFTACLSAQNDIVLALEIEVRANHESVTASNNSLKSKIEEMDDVLKFMG